MRYRETKATQRLPVNLYETTNGKGTGAVYYRYKHPTTKKFHGMGKDKVEAIKAAESCFLSSGFSQAGQSTNRSSLIFCIASSSCSQAAQR